MQPDLQVCGSYSLLVYPFRHALSGKDRAERLKRLGASWRPWWHRLTEDRDLERTLDDTWFFRPYLRRLLFPETEQLPKADPRGQLRPARAISRYTPAELDATIKARDAMLRLTFDPARLKTWQPLRIEDQRGFGKAQQPFVAPFTLEWIDVVLCPWQIGLLALKVKMQQPEATVADLRDFYLCMQMVLPRTIGWQLAQWVGTIEGAAVRFEGRDLVDFLLQGLTEVSPHIQETRLPPFVERLSKASPEGRYTAQQTGQGYGQSFHLFNYACLDDSRVPVTPIPQPHHRGPLASPVNRALYELATISDTSHEDWTPHPSALRNLWKRHRLALWRNWQTLALHDNVMFMGRADSRFVSRTLLHNVEGEYFSLFLLVLFQKTRLSMMFEELLEKDTNLRRNHRRARHMWNSFIRFQNRCWFHEVTRRPQGHHLYHCFQRALNCPPLFKEMKEEVEALQDHYERVAERGINRKLAFLTLVGLPAGLLAQFYSDYIKQHYLEPLWGDLGVDQFWGTCAVAVGIVLAFWIGEGYWRRWWD